MSAAPWHDGLVQPARNIVSIRLIRMVLTSLGVSAARGTIAARR